MRGTGCCLGVLAEGDSLLLLGVDGLGEALCLEATLLTASGFVAASGGGNGDMETLDMDAE